MHRLHLVAAVLALEAAVAPSRAQGSPPEALRVEADRCPSADAIEAALVRVLPGTRLSSTASDVVTVTDDGDGFHVVVHGQVSAVVDRKRDCAERALTSAVFAAFILDPPAPPAAPAAPAVTAPALPSRTAARRLHVELELDGVFVIASQNKLVTGGGAARVYVGTSWLGGTLGITGLGPAKYDPGVSSARIVRVPIDLGLRGRLRRGQLGLSADLGFVVSPLLASDSGAYGYQGIDVGGRIAVSAQLRRWKRFAPFFAAELVATTRRQLDVGGFAAPETPPVWFGFALGVDTILF